MKKSNKYLYLKMILEFIAGLTYMIAVVVLAIKVSWYFGLLFIFGVQINLGD